MITLQTDLDPKTEISNIPAKPPAPYYVRALALGLPAILLGIQISGWIGIAPAILHGHSDFRQLYTAGYMVRTGHGDEIYDYGRSKGFQDRLISPEQIALPFNHLAYETLLYVPFSRLRYRLAFFAFLGTNLLLLVVSFKLLRRRMDHLAEVWEWLPVAMFVTYLPFAATLMQGQDSLVLLTLLTAAMVLLDDHQEFMAGLMIALGLFKFQIILPIGFLFLFWRRWRFTAGFAVSAALVSLTSLWIVGWAQVQVYAGALVSMSIHLSSRAEQVMYGISPTSMPNIRGLIYGVANGYLSSVAIQAITIVASGAVLGMLAWTGTRLRAADALPLAITTSVLVSYHLLFHDLSVLFIPIVLILNRLMESEATNNKQGRSITRTATLMFAAPICMSFIPSHFYLVSLPIVALLFVLIRAANVDPTQLAAGVHQPAVEMP